MSRRRNGKAKAAVAALACGLAPLGAAGRDSSHGPGMMGDGMWPGWFLGPTALHPRRAAAAFGHPA